MCGAIADAILESKIPGRRNGNFETPLVGNRTLALFLRLKKHAEMCREFGCFGIKVQCIFKTSKFSFILF